MPITKVVFMYLLYGTIIQIPKSLSGLSMPLHKKSRIINLEA